MTAAPKRNLPDLRGEALFAALAQSQDVDGLELLWRAEQPELAQRLASHLASVGDPRLGDLLLSELSAPTMPASVVRPHILAAIDDYQPPLSQQGVRLLDETLRNSTSSALVPVAERGLWERWLFAQPGRRRDEYALVVIENEADLEPAAGTLAAALTRCADNPELRARAAQAYCARFVESQDSVSWGRAADFIEGSCTPTNRQPEVLALVDELVRSAPELIAASPIRPTLNSLIRQHGQVAIEQLLSGTGRAPASVGMTRLLAIADSFVKQEERLRVFMLAYGHHPSQWPALEPLARAWDNTRWGAGPPSDPQDT